MIFSSAFLYLCFFLSFGAIVAPAVFVLDYLPYPLPSSLLLPTRISHEYLHSSPLHSALYLASSQKVQTYNLGNAPFSCVSLLTIPLSCTYDDEKKFHYLSECFLFLPSSVEYLYGRREYTDKNLDA